MRLLLALLLLSAAAAPAQAQAPVPATQTPAASAQTPMHEPYRPQLHFSPKEKWMNDPNGLVFYQGVYHLFFQYYPKDIVWGPMHWGHATSKDLIHWRQQPIALYPDNLGYIFSGSAVIDSNNTSGLGKDGKIPLVAIFTHHDPKGEKSGSKTYQNQSLAYSLDGGNTWTKYRYNPVLKNPGITDFRDPSVSWYDKGKKWIMSLATKDRITFYSSPDLKQWTKESEFGQQLGAHGGVWECPNLFPLSYKDSTYWVLLVSSNPGGPNGGSGTQYFIGQFDGSSFRNIDTLTRWIDYGPDDYAGVTWNNTGHRRIFIGWMSNWDYANQVPTKTWRNAMTLPRDLHLQRLPGGLFLASRPSPEIYSLTTHKKLLPVTIDSSIDLSALMKDSAGRYILQFQGESHSFSIALSNDYGQQLIIGYDQPANQYYIDRSGSGQITFHPGFGGKYTAPRLGSAPHLDGTIILDASSLELFADKGLTVMTGIFFPDKPFTRIRLGSAEPRTLRLLSLSALASIQ